MKKMFYVFCIWMFLSINVNAESHDVHAKYDSSYNMETYNISLNNNSKEISIDNYLLEFSSSNKIDVLIIKMDKEGNDYAKSFTNSEVNYYIKVTKKNNNDTVNIDIKTLDKVLNIYDNLGNLNEINNDKIKLDKDYYIFSITKSLEKPKEDYLITDINSLLESIKEVNNIDESKIKIYNSKNNLISNSSPLGTGYKIIINEGMNNSKEYTVVAMGDTTGDAIVNLNDVSRLYHYYKKIINMDESYVLAGNVANNDVINLNDVTKIYHYYKKIIPKL